MSKYSSTRSLILALTLLSSGRLSAAEPSAPSGQDPVVSFSGSVVSASNIKKGGQVVFYAVGLVPDGYESFVHHWAQVVSDDDGDGAVRFDAGVPIPCRSIWAVVDLTNGQYSMAAPPGCALRSTTLSKKALRGSPAAVLSFSHERPFLDLLYVSPAKGVWVGKAADGQAGDGDGKRDHVTTVALGSLKSLTTDASPPGTLVPGGILVAIDLYRMDVVAVRVDPKLLSEVLP